ncbi:MAG: cell division protein FtsZ, partial [Alphaproteobacteria bacterium]
ELQQYVDTLIVIPNQNLFRVANETTTFADAFRMADNVLQSGVRGVTDLMVMPGLINLDFADIRTVMGEMGKAMMGTGEADGDQRGLKAAEAAIANPLLDDVTMKGARGVLINITGGLDMTLFEVDEAANRIREEVDPEANIIFGSTFDEALDGRMRVSVVATGIDLKAEIAPRPTRISLVAEGGRAIPAGKSAAGPAARAETAWADLAPAAEETPATAEAEAMAAPMDPPFIAPEPVIPAPAAAKQAAPDPFAAAAMANGTRRETAERPSLFERMTGTGRAARPSRETATAEPAKPMAKPMAKPVPPTLERAAPPKAPERRAPSLEESRPVTPAPAPTPAPARSAAPAQPPKPAAPMAPAAPAAPVQPRFDDTPAIEADASSPEADPEEDLLEIPAFLRRQAN